MRCVVLRQTRSILLEYRIGDMAAVQTLQPVELPRANYVIATHKPYGNE